MSKPKIRDVPPSGINMMHFSVYAGGKKQRFIRISEDKIEMEVCLDADEAVTAALAAQYVAADRCGDDARALPRVDGDARVSAAAPFGLRVLPVPERGRMARPAAR